MDAGLPPAVLGSWMHEFVRQMQDAVVVAEAGSGRILLTNRQSQLKGEGPWTLAEQQHPIYHLDGRPYEPGTMMLDRSLAGEVVVAEEFIWMSPRREKRTFVCSSWPLRDTSGAIVAAVSIAHDTTDQARDLKEEAALEKLTAREVEVLQAIADGLSSQAVADKLAISLRTERNHVSSILSKLGVHSQLQALVVAVRHGIVEIDRLAGEHRLRFL
jgi:DNA-binding CsgD family transcriptional regulator